MSVLDDPVTGGQRPRDTTIRVGAAVADAFASLDEFVVQPRIAYFSMEIALRNEIPTYAGGLGVLAGDSLRSAADLHLPLVGVTLVSRAGYFRQRLDDDGLQHEEPEPWDPARWAARVSASVAIPLENRDVWVTGWLHVVQGAGGGRTPVILLDTDSPLNSEEDRRITDVLYGGDESYRLKQEVVLGVGGMKLLQALGFQVGGYHLNEGHSALLMLALLRRHAYPPDDVGAGEVPWDVPRVRERCTFTTHTPVDAGQDQFEWALVRKVLGEIPELPFLRQVAGPDRLNMTRLALGLSEFINGVGSRHAETSRRMFPGHRVHSVSNGVHPRTWTCPMFAKLYDAHVPGWCHEPQLLIRADHLSDDEIWTAHEAAKRSLFGMVESRAGVRLDPLLPTVGFARRMTAYKRPDLLFTDLPRLRDLAGRRPFQLVVAGKAHPRDEGGKRIIAQLRAHQRELRDVLRIALVPGYDLELAQAMVSGVDVWLNTPQPPLEASGTSGMKAAFNGVPHLSVMDGWWVDGYIPGVTGWKVEGSGPVSDERDAAALYRVLDDVVLPLYTADRSGWIAMMKGAITRTASCFSSHRMMRRYATEAYLR